MKLPITLSIYIGKKFLAGTMVVFTTLMAIIFLFDFVELTRRGLSREVPFGIIIGMGFLKLPSMAEQILPFAILLGGILSFTRLTATSELVVTRSAGVSAWQFLMPAFGIAAAIGIFIVVIFNPLSAIMLSKFENLEAKYFKGSASMLSVSSTGLWLRQQNDATLGKTIINALRVSHEDMELFDVTIFIFGENDKFVKRIDAKSAKLGDGYWNISSGILTVPGLPASARMDYRLKTSLNQNQIQESFASPETMSFWELPSFIRTLKAAGFSALRHTLYWHSVLSTPFLLCAMVFFAAAFSLRPPRHGKIGIMMSGGILSGFMIYFLSDLISAIGLSGSIPVIMAAWAPVGISILLGTALMLHLEDG
jgi:lipopolysaccharide export system permease protein